jgi:hypothetical protein
MSKRTRWSPRVTLPIIGLAVSLAAIIGLRASAQNAVSETGIPTATLTGIAEQSAAANGDATPESAEVVATTRAKAALLMSGADVDTDQAVYLIQEQGSFTGVDAPIPPGVKPPTGQDLYVAVDAKTMEQLDWGILPAPVSLTSLGSPISLDPASQQPG